MTFTRGQMPELYSNYKSKPAPKLKPLPIHKVLKPAPKKAK
jgi:hypothetical protein